MKANYPVVKVTMEKAIQSMAANMQIVVPRKVKWIQIVMKKFSAILHQEIVAIVKGIITKKIVATLNVIQPLKTVVLQNQSVILQLKSVKKTFVIQQLKSALLQSQKCNLRKPLWQVHARTGLCSTPSAQAT